mmetsp:Transcript_54452/g.127133  ORF Transcript_54452/g.127133 Transcript_54452/m.127133 type:complete len:237 (+) Transcript_54452:1236-1946(+)
MRRARTLVHLIWWLADVCSPEHFLCLQVRDGPTLKSCTHDVIFADARDDGAIGTIAGYVSNSPKQQPQADMLHDHPRHQGHKLLLIQTPGLITINSHHYSSDLLLFELWIYHLPQHNHKRISAQSTRIILIVAFEAVPDFPVLCFGQRSKHHAVPQCDEVCSGKGLLLFCAQPRPKDTHVHEGILHTSPRQRFHGALRGYLHWSCECRKRYLQVSSKRSWQLWKLSWLSFSNVEET